MVINPGPPSQSPPERALCGEMERLRRAMVLARQIYPGPVGELVFEELRTWESFGYRFGGTIVHRIVEHLINKAEREE